MHWLTTGLIVIFKMPLPRAYSATAVKIPAKGGRIYGSAASPKSPAITHTRAITLALLYPSLSIIFDMSRAVATCVRKLSAIRTARFSTVTP
jgi:hypothetical protein